MYFRCADNPDLSSHDIIYVGRSYNFVLILHFSPEKNIWYFVAKRQRFEYNSLRRGIVFDSRELCEAAATHWAYVHRHEVFKYEL